MSENIKEGIASDAVKTQLAKYALDEAHNTKIIEVLTEENKALRKQLDEATSVIENDLKADLKLKIMAASDYDEAGLESLNVAQLQTIDETLSKSKGFDAVVTYKSIRAGNVAADTNARLTVGNLYNLKRDSIIKMGGDF
jgi:hypothetical protein